MGLTEQEKKMLKVLQKPSSWAEAILNDPKVADKPLRLRDYQKNMIDHPAIRKVSRAGRRIGKCLSGDANINTVDGPIKAKDLFLQTNKPKIITFDDTTYKLKSTSDYFIYENGIKKVYKIKTRDGKTTLATGNHPFYVEGEGWIMLEQIVSGDKIATVKCYSDLINEKSHIADNLIHDILIHNNLITMGTFIQMVMESDLDSIKRFLQEYCKTFYISENTIFVYRSYLKEISYLFTRIGINHTIGDSSITYQNIKWHEISTYYVADEPQIDYEEVESVEFYKEEMTYDLTVPGTSSLVSDNIISHNTLSMSVFILWYAFTHENSRQVIATPYDSQIEVIFDMLTSLIENSPIMKSVKKSYTKSPYRKIILNNGAIISGFTAGTKTGGGGGSMRGQAADWIYMDEVDYMSDADFETIYAISLEAPARIGVWVSSTPTGRRGKFWACCQPNSGWTEFHYPTYVVPEWSPAMEKELRGVFSPVAYDHEVLAEFGSETIGVFNKDFIDRSKRDYQYNTHPRYDAPRMIGVDWDKLKINSKRIA